jgi:uncharacterized protein (DUF4415 family)
MFARAVARKGLKPVSKKALLSLRIDADVIEWFKSQGSGYQSRMNACCGHIWKRTSELVVHRSSALCP